MLSLGDRGAARSLTGTGRSGVLALLSLLAVAVFACGGPPKQAEVADVDKESGMDMAASDESVAAPAASAEGGEQAMQVKCCAECKTGAAKDRTGAPKNTIPCADFTEVLSPWCLEHFRLHPAMASECG